MDSSLDLKGLMNVMRGFMISKALFVAHELDIFDRLANGGKRALELANETDSSEKGTRKLCNVLSSLGLLLKEGDKYFLPDNLRKFLLKDGKNSHRYYIDSLHAYWYIWSDLERVIKEGKPVTSITELRSKDKNTLKNFIQAQHYRGKEASRLICNVVDISNSRRMLDVGAGPGTYSLEWMTRFSQLRSTLLDLPHVLEITDEYVRIYGMEEKVIFISGNFHEADFGGENYDLVLMANILHLYGAEENRNLIKKAYDSLEESGRVIIHCWALDDNECEPVESALLALTMFSATPNGSAYKRSEQTEWLQEAGFKDIRHFEIDVIPSTLITAIKLKSGLP